MRLAVIGAGISGLVAAYLLSPKHEVTVFEANARPGGHSHTVGVTVDDRVYPVDTGFVVFNETTYPNFTKLLRHLGVTWQPANMSFSITNAQSGIEFGFRTLNGLFAQRRNLVRPAFYHLLFDIWRFQRESGELSNDETFAINLGNYLADKKYSRPFIEQFIIPLGSSIWSANPLTFQNFPARYFAEFFQRHRFLNLRHKVRWQTIQGGSRRYVESLTGSFKERLRLNCPVAWVKRQRDFVEVKPLQGELERFDQVIISAHSDQALALLADASAPEREILFNFPYQENSTVLHTDLSLMPARRAAWASWNYYMPPGLSEQVTVTYHMNRLQNLDAPVEFLVTLNRDQEVDPQRIIKHLMYHHPVYTQQAPRTQQRWPEINGVNRTYFCGAYWGCGFHEDGVVSALNVCRHFGVGL